MRLRPLTEAECYARCYGRWHEEPVNVIRLLRTVEQPAEDAARRERGDATEAEAA